MQQRGRGMRSFVLSLAAALAVAGPSFAQSNTTGTATPQVIRGSSANPAVKKTAAVANQPTVVRPPARQTQQQRATTPETLRGSRYGGFAPAPSGPPPVLDTTSPRTLSLVNFNTQEVLTVTYWSNGAYHREALDKLNHFLRDSRDNAQTEMDPLLFDVLWHTAQHRGLRRLDRGAVGLSLAHDQRLAGQRQPRRGARQPAHERQRHGHPLPRRAGVQDPPGRLSLNMGGVGFYPRSGFVHLDTGPVRYW